jgi:NADPH-dependent 2,4-dienoyl-CoA reductase/sulfur reductase-like enzyme/rhodanese-related sulfurtransferase
VLSPGAEPVKPPIPGIQDPAIFTLRSVKETDAIKSYLDEQQPKRAVVVGGGFIGLEMAENLHERGIRVTLVEMAQQVMNLLDYEMAAEVHKHLKTNEVEFYLKDGVAQFERHDDGLTVVLQSGRRIESDVVILSIGVRPENKLAKEAGLDIGETGGIKVDEHLRTNDPDIYAIGDAIEYPHAVTGKPTITYLAGPANKQGRLTADNIVHGDVKRYPGAIGTAVAKVFDLTVAITGVSEKSLHDQGVPYRSVITHSSSHAGYYPDAKPLSVKTLFSPDDGKLLGAQIVGYEGVDKRIDLFATVLRHGGTVEELTEIEHAYAPPYSSAKDPVNIAGFVAENVLTGRSRHIQWHEVLDYDVNELFILDVRTPEEFERGTVEGAVNIPNTELRERIDEVPRDKQVVTVCGVGLRAYQAERILRQHGFERVANLSGGYTTYSAATAKQSNEDIFANDVIYKDDNIYQANPEESESRARSRAAAAHSAGER